MAEFGQLRTGRAKVVIELNDLVEFIVKKDLREEDRISSLVEDHEEALIIARAEKITAETTMHSNNEEILGDADELDDFDTDLEDHNETLERQIQEYQNIQEKRVKTYWKQFYELLALEKSEK